ncbi:unnamed protein product [Rotaria sordida]|uniref:Transposase n=1 Tax=Rotaria sordida TaxID=392033 RepID=A0A818TSH0_9BILA|nr:unnamed protein product [Rotaria sordida]CAF3690823.1 unnamed protein product [Rotaria sordida]
MDKEYFRFYIEVHTALHTVPIVIHNELHTVFGDEASPLRTVQRWSKWFRESREEVEDEERSGRPITETTSENIRNVRNLINDNPYVTVGELETQSVEKITACYVSEYLTNFQKAERIRICQENWLKFEQRVWRLYDVVTSDESWFCHKQIGRKSLNAA